MSLEENLRQIVREEIRAALRELGSTTAPAPGDTLLTVPEACALTKLGDSTIRGWIRTGVLKRHGKPRTPRVSRIELMQRMEEAGRETRTEVTQQDVDLRATAILDKVGGRTRG